MNIEEALVGQARPLMLASRVRALVQAEFDKGCRTQLYPQPVALEPRFSPITGEAESAVDHRPYGILEEPPPEQELRRFRVWLSPRQSFDWRRSERFLKQLQSVRSRVGLEIRGNNREIVVDLLVHRHDATVLEAAFRGEFDACALTLASPEGWDEPRLWTSAALYDYVPPPPYSHLLTRPDELGSSPLESLLAGLCVLPDSVLGVYQLLFQPVAADHNWHRNIQILLDLEYLSKLLGGSSFLLRVAQQAPSGDLRQMAQDLSIKAHSDKPLFACAFRLAILGAGDSGPSDLQALATFSHLFLHGGRPLGTLTQVDYARSESPPDLRSMLIRGLTYRPGFLLNSLELTGLVHWPSFPAVDRRPKFLIKTLDPLALEGPELDQGTPIGIVELPGELRTVCIPSEVRRCHTHLIGRSGMGKSTMIEHMILDDIRQGRGVAVIDPHGDLVESLLDHMPPEKAERVIYLNPGDPDYVPLWNPLQRVPGQDPGRMANELVGAFKRFVEGWGDRMENLLRQAFFGLLHLEGSTFLDVTDLFRRKGDESRRLRDRILDVVDNEEARQFWLRQFEGYKNEDFGPPLNKLSKLLVNDTVSRMFFQPHSAFQFRQVMDEGQILLVNLATIDSETRNVLGCFILSLLYLSATSRSDIPPDQRLPFDIYVDEAHRFLTDALEDLVAEIRKYNVSLTLAHQYFKQFDSRKSDALSGVGATVAFRVDARDAQHLIKDLQEQVTVSDLTALEKGQAVVRCGTRTVRVQTFPPAKTTISGVRDRILSYSRMHYYRPAAQIREMIRLRHRRWDEPFSALAPPIVEESPEEWIYDEFK